MALQSCRGCLQLALWMIHLNQSHFNGKEYTVCARQYEGFKKFVIVHVCELPCHGVLRRSGHNVPESILFFHLGGSSHWTHFVKLVGNHLYPLSCFSSFPLWGLLKENLKLHLLHFSWEAVVLLFSPHSASKGRGLKRGWWVTWLACSCNTQPSSFIPSLPQNLFWSIFNIRHIESRVLDFHGYYKDLQ